MKRLKHIGHCAPIVIVLALWLSACGSTPTPAASGNAAPTATAAPAVTGLPTTTKTLTNGCPIQTIPVDPQPPAQVIVNQPGGAKATPIMLSMGQSMEIHLSSAISWHLNLADPNQILTASGLAGWYNKTLTACIWRYNATKVGSATFTFTGTPLCQPGQVCSQVAIESDFEVTVQ